MISQTVKRRVQELMLGAKGDKAEVERQLKALTERDPAFLKELTAPYLKGIIAHAISVAGSSSREARPAPPVESLAPMDQVMRKLQQNIGGGESTAISSARQTASIHKLIKAQASKRKEK